MEMKNKSNQKLHFRDSITIKNLVPLLRETFPELEDAFKEYSESDPDFESKYTLLGGSLFLPFLKDFLHSKHQDPLLAKRLFHFLEKMARSTDWDVQNILAVSILESLSQSEITTAQKYMGPKTREVLKDVEKYLEKLFLKK